MYVCRSNNNVLDVDKKNHQDQSDHARRTIAPAAAVGPGGERSEQDQDQNDDKDRRQRCYLSGLLVQKKCARSAGQRYAARTVDSTGSRRTDALAYVFRSQVST